MTYVNLAQSQEALVAEQAKKYDLRVPRLHPALRVGGSAELQWGIPFPHHEKYTGYTLKAYCHKIQMQEAARLLSSTRLPVTQIAYALGYENRTQFYHNFKKEFHMTPAEYRTGGR